MKITIFNNSVTEAPEFTVNLSNKNKANTYSVVCNVKLQPHIAGTHNMLSKIANTKSIRSTSNIIKNTLSEYDYIGAIENYIVAYNTGTKSCLFYDFKNKTIQCIKTTHYSSWEVDVNKFGKANSQFGLESLEYNIRTNHQKIIKNLESTVVAPELDEVDNIINERVSELKAIHDTKVTELENELAELKRQLEEKMTYQNEFLSELEKMENENKRLTEVEERTLDLFNCAKELGFDSFSGALEWIENNKSEVSDGVQKTVSLGLTVELDTSEVELNELLDEVFETDEKSVIQVTEDDGSNYREETISTASTASELLYVNKLDVDNMSIDEAQRVYIDMLVDGTLDNLNDHEYDVLYEKYQHCLNGKV